MTAKKKQIKPIAVLISDVHYSMATYELADEAFRAAIDKAAQLDVPLIDCGDLTNDKDILRGTYVNRIIETMQYALSREVTVMALIGNHSLINEKGDEHTLHFLEPYCITIETPKAAGILNFIPYQNTSEKFLAAIKTFPKGSIVIGHQGTLGGYLGDYVKDSSAFDPELVKDYKVFLGHYHRHYELGTTVSVGNPYTLTFGEAQDGPKGFLVLYSDGSYTREILTLRKHRIVEMEASDLPGASRLGIPPRPEDKVWVKLSGTRAELDKISKQNIASLLRIQDFKLDKIPTDSESPKAQVETMTDAEIFDMLIEGTPEEPHVKDYLKALWRDIV